MKFYQNKQTKEIILTNSTIENANYSELIPNTVEASTEKHLPVVDINGDIVKISIGSVIHPMTDEHLITSIYLLTTKGYYVRNLTSSDTPIINFKLNDEEVIEVYEYCNLHGLWCWKNN